MRNEAWAKTEAGIVSVSCGTRRRPRRVLMLMLMLMLMMVMSCPHRPGSNSERLKYKDEFLSFSLECVRDCPHSIRYQYNPCHSQRLCCGVVLVSRGGAVPFCARETSVRGISSWNEHHRRFIDVYRPGSSLGRLWSTRVG